MPMRSTLDGREVQQPALEPLAISHTQAADLIGISARMLSSFVATDAVPSVKVGSRRLYNLDEIRAWLSLGAPTTPGSAAKVRQHIERKGAPR